MSTQDLRKLSRGQLAMTLGGRIGQRATLTTTSGTSVDVVIGQRAVDGLEGEGAYETLLVCQSYADSRQIVFPIKALRTLTPTEFAITDPRHPDFDREQMPVEVIKPRTVQRKVGTPRANKAVTW